MLAFAAVFEIAIRQAHKTLDAYVQMHEDDKIVESKDVLTEDFYI